MTFDLQRLMRRVAETPAAFLAAPRSGAGAGVEVAAVVGELLESLNLRAQGDELDELAAEQDANRLSTTLVACWLLADPAFREQNQVGFKLKGRFLPLVVPELASATPAREFVTDPERREELVRTVLDHFLIDVPGEPSGLNRERLSSLSAASRKQVTEAAERRAREVREALAAQLAAESADKWSRE